MRLALFGRLHVAVDQHDRNARIRRHVGDTGAHEARADDPDLAQLGRRHVLGTARALVQFLHRQEQRADHRRRFLRAQDFGKPARLDLQGLVHRELEALVDGFEDRVGGRVIVLRFAPVDGIGGGPDLHARGGIDLVGRQLEVLLVPRSDRRSALLDPVLGDA